MANQIQKESKTNVFIPEIPPPADETEKNTNTAIEQTQLPPDREVDIEIETKIEETGSQKIEQVEKKSTGLKAKLKRKQKKQYESIPQVRDGLTLKIEKIMEEDLEDVFGELTAIQKQEFKIKGEKTAFEIRNLLNSTKIKVKKIFEFLLEWLKILPGINKFFLEQEAKIKADKIIALQQNKKK